MFLPWLRKLDDKFCAGSIILECVRAALPFMVVVVAVFNEQMPIAARIENLRQHDVPRDLFWIMVEFGA